MNVRGNTLLNGQKIVKRRDIKTLIVSHNSQLPLIVYALAVLVERKYSCAAATPTPSSIG
jgi:hypothetical protein